MSFGGWILMGLFWVILIVLVGAMVAGLLPGGRRSGPPDLDTPREILARRFARGELDVEQYRQAREELREGRKSAS